VVPVGTGRERVAQSIFAEVEALVDALADLGSSGLSVGCEFEAFGCSYKQSKAAGKKFYPRLERTCGLAPGVGLISNVTTNLPVPWDISSVSVEEPSGKVDSETVAKPKKSSLPIVSLS